MAEMVAPAATEEVVEGAIALEFIAAAALWEPSLMSVFLNSGRRVLRANQTATMA